MPRPSPDAAPELVPATAEQQAAIDRLSNRSLSRLNTVNDQVALTVSQGEDVSRVLSDTERLTTTAWAGNAYTDDDGSLGTAAESRNVHFEVARYLRMFERDHRRTGFGGAENPHGNHSSSKDVPESQWDARGKYIGRPSLRGR